MLSSTIPSCISNYIDYSLGNEEKFQELVSNSIGKNRYCIIKTKSFQNAKAFMNFLVSMFGSPQSQNSLGVIEEKIIPIGNSTKYINNREAQPLHTDNAYSDISPGFMALRCEKKALLGGETLIVNVDQVLEYLKQSYPNSFDILFEPDSITYIKDNKKISKSILRRSLNGQIEINFTVFANVVIGKTKECERLFMSLVEFLHLPSNQRQYLLDDHDIIVTDNRFILHGRKAFEGERRILRTWYKMKMNE